MAHNIQSAFDYKHIDAVLQFVSEYRFRLGTLETEITIRLYRKLDSSGYFFDQSHYIATPLQGTPYVTSRPWNDSEAAAINQVVSAMNEHYSAALGKGHKPDESWLALNKHFSK